MTSLAAIEKQIAALRKQADAIRKTDFAAAIAKAKSLIAEFDLSAQDLGLAGRKAKQAKGERVVGKRKSAPVKSGVPKYRDPKSGKTWTGMGKPPAWIAGAKDRQAFLIGMPATELPAQPTTVKTPVKKASKRVNKVASAAPKKRALAAKKATAAVTSSEAVSESI